MLAICCKCFLAKGMYMNCLIVMNLGKLPWETCMVILMQTHKDGMVFVVEISEL